MRKRTRQGGLSERETVKAPRPRPCRGATSERPATSRRAGPPYRASETPLRGQLGWYRDDLRPYTVAGVSLFFSENAKGVDSHEARSAAAFVPLPAALRLYA